MKGHCLCGGIEFEAEEIPGMVFNCHCSRCRTSHGADYATQAFAVRASLRFLRGQNLLSEYLADGGGVRAFCSVCGSRLMNYAKDGGDYLSLAIACIDGYQGKAIAHCFTGSKAPWHQPGGDLPAYQELPNDHL